MDTNTIDFHIPRWEELPNIDLYMDQVVSFVEESLTNLLPYKDDKEDKFITKTMINNYVKQGILNSPINKKYNRTHLARLIVICMLKQVYSINDINALIILALETSGIEISYNKFCITLVLPEPDEPPIKTFCNFLISFTFFIKNLLKVSLVLLYQISCPKKSPYRIFIKKSFLP